MNQVVPAELVTELDLGSARGGKAGSRERLVVAVVRPLVEADLPAIANPPPVGSKVQTVQALRTSHHQLAQLLAEGKELAEISRVTGYSTTWISNLQTDPAFNELIAYYSAQRDLVFIDAQERMKVLGLDAAGELHTRLHEKAQEFSNRELMEVIELALGPSLAPKAPAGAPGGVSGLCLEVKFVAPSGPVGPAIDTTASAPFTDLTPIESSK